MEINVKLRMSLFTIEYNTTLRANRAKQLYNQTELRVIFVKRRDRRTKMKLFGTKKVNDPEMDEVNSVRLKVLLK